MLAVDSRSMVMAVVVVPSGEVVQVMLICQGVIIEARGSSLSGAVLRFFI